MAKKKAKAGLATTTQASPRREPHQVVKHGFFPFARYTSVVGVHTTLLVFTALFLPRTNLFLTKSTATQMTSRDRPQHPFLQALTVNPLSTMMCVCFGTAVLQAWWGGWMRNWAIEFALVGSDDEKKLEKAGSDAHKFTVLKMAWFATILASFLAHAILVLFGAPIASHVLHTYLLALLTSILTVFTPAYTLGVPTRSLVNRLTWVRLFAELSVRNPIERAIVYPAIGVMLGCWAGVIPIALDWDRPWQAWPLTSAFCIILGYILGSFIALSVSATIFLADEHIHSIERKTS